MIVQFSLLRKSVFKIFLRCPRNGLSKSAEIAYISSRVPRTSITLTKTPPDIVAELMANISAPTIVSDIDKAIVLLDQQREELVELRKMALRRHGASSATFPLKVITTSHGGVITADESVSQLIARYKADPSSPFHKLRFKTREHYETLMKRLDKDIGREGVASFDLPKLRSIHGRWAAGGKFAMAHSLITMMRILASYGATDPNNRASRELKSNFQYLEIESPKSQAEPLTLEQVDLIIAKAIEMGSPSVALVQAFQSDLKFRQKDVIGEWVPVSEPVESDVIDGDIKWISGLRWEEIDNDFVVRHPPSNGSKMVEMGLKEAPRVMAQLRSACGQEPVRDLFPVNGPVVFRESTQKPWRAGEFRRIWRKIATAAGLPPSAKNAG